MKLALVAIAALLMCGCAEPGPSSQSVPGASEDEVRTLLDEYRAAVAERDTAALKSMYVDDGRFRWIEDGELRYGSPGEVIAALAALPVEVTFETRYEDVEVSLVGPSGARAAMRFRTTMGDGPSAFEFGGMASMVLEKDDGTWRIVGGHTSTSRPDAY